MKKALCFCLACFLLSRAIVLGSAYLTFYSFDKPPAPPGYVESGQGPLDEKPLNVLYFYDATHYMKIAQEGYTLTETPWFPLYPLLIKLFGGTPAAGVLLSNLLFFIGLVGLYKLAGAKGVLLASVTPIGLVFSAIHSESLFFCLATWFMVALAAGKKEWAGILAGLAALSRPPGWALAAYLAVAAVGELVRGGTGRRLESVLAPPVIAGAIGLAYPVFLLCHYGLADILAVRVEARTFMPFWWGTVTDLRRLAALNDPGMKMIMILNLYGWVFIVTAFFSSRFTAPSALYALFILSFPVTKEGYVFATHGLLRYACAWPSAYGGMVGKFAGRFQLAVLVVLMAGMAVIIASLLAQKVFLF